MDSILNILAGLTAIIIALVAGLIQVSLIVAIPVLIGFGIAKLFI